MRVLRRTSANQIVLERSERKRLVTGTGRQPVWAFCFLRYEIADVSGPTFPQYCSENSWNRHNLIVQYSAVQWGGPAAEYNWSGRM